MAEKRENNRGRNWTFVFYPDSAPEDYISVIRNWNIEVYLSPLHDADVNGDESEKKAHWHIVLCFSGNKSLEQVQRYSDELSGVHLVLAKNRVADKRIMVRYLVHYDNPEKHQYEVSEIQEFGGADALSFFVGEKEDSGTILEMMEWCEAQGVTSFAKLAKYAAHERPEWFRCLTTRRTYFMMHYLKSLEYDFRSE